MSDTVSSNSHSENNQKDQESGQKESDADSQPSDAIVDHKFTDGNLFYKIHYSGRDEAEDEWLDVDSVNPELIDKYVESSCKAYTGKNVIQSVQYGVEKDNKIIYHVVFIDGNEADLSSFEMRLNYPLELIKFLEKTSFSIQ